MAGMRRAQLPDGRVVWVNEMGQVVGISEGMGGAEPGFGSDARTRDIYSRLPDADVVGLVGPGVVPGGEKSVGIQRGSGTTPPNVRPMQGSQANNRGNSVIISPGTTAPLIVSTPPNPGEDAEMISVVLGFGFANGDQDTDVNIDPLTMKALLTWGIGNAIFSAECDWTNGAIITLPASFVRVGARFDATGDGVVDVKLDAGLAYGNLGRGRSARFTQQVRTALDSLTIPPGAQLGPFRIPLFATSFNVTSCTDGGGAVMEGPATPILVCQCATTEPPAGGGRNGSAYSFSAGNNLGQLNEEAVPVCNGSRYVWVENQSLANANINIVYNLAF
jgi:hypothetical protein